MRNRYSWHLSESKDSAGVTGIYWLQFEMAVMVTWRPGGTHFSPIFRQLNATTSSGCWLNTHSVVYVVMSLTSAPLSAVPCLPVLNMMHLVKKTKNNWKANSSAVGGKREKRKRFRAAVDIFLVCSFYYELHKSNSIHACFTSEMDMANSEWIKPKVFAFFGICCCRCFSLTSSPFATLVTKPVGLLNWILAHRGK